MGEKGPKTKMELMCWCVRVCVCSRLYQLWIRWELSDQSQSGNWIRLGRVPAPSWQQFSPEKKETLFAREQSCRKLMPPFTFFFFKDAPVSRPRIGNEKEATQWQFSGSRHFPLSASEWKAQAARKSLSGLRAHRHLTLFDYVWKSSDAFVECSCWGFGKRLSDIARQHY